MGGIEGVVEAGEAALVTDAAAGELKPGRKPSWRGASCANCGAKLAGPHCHVCGQVADDLHRPFWTLIKEAVDGLFSVDGRLLRTMPALLFRPGRITKSYLDGARARYVAPFRLYLVSAVLFLLAVSFVAGDWTEFDPNEGPDVTTLEDLIQQEQDLANAAANTRAAGEAEAADRIEETRQEIVQAIEERRADEEAGTFETERLAQRERDKCVARRTLLVEELGPRCTALLAGDGEPMELNEFFVDWPIELRRMLLNQSETIIDDPRRFFVAINNWISRVLIGLFPFYALILAVMHFWKRRFYFYDHLIVSLHFHSFIFVLTSVLIVLGRFTPTWPLLVVFVLWGHFYIYRVHRMVYGCGRFSSALRTLVLDLLYLCVLVFVPVVLAVGGFLTA